MPNKQRSDMCCLVFLVLSGIQTDSTWDSATNQWIGIHEIIQKIKEDYDISYAENTRENVRDDVIHPLRDAAIVEDNGSVTNSGNYKYRLTNEALALCKTINSPEWEREIDIFLSEHEKLIEIYSSKREMIKIPVTINGENLKFSPGNHNELQKAIIEEFAPRFAPGAECLYVGDTTKRDLVKNEEKLRALGLEITLHDKMPDVVLYRKDNNWIYFIEAVASGGSMDFKRINEIQKMTKNTKTEKIFITAFLDFKTYKKFSDKLAWETEVWIADTPDHMIHLNGDKFLGPRQ